MSTPTTAGGQIAGLTAEQQLEALHVLWEQQQAIWRGLQLGTTTRMCVLLNENAALGTELRNLVAERNALLAQPSKLFEPSATTTETRQHERAAFAAGLHHATILQRHAPARGTHQEASCATNTKPT